MHLRVFDAITMTGKMIIKAVNYIFNEMFIVVPPEPLVPLSLMESGHKREGMSIFGN